MDAVKRNLIWLGIIGQLLCYGAIWLFDCEFVLRWFYTIIWWSYLFIIDGIIYRLKGNSLIVNRAKSFLWMLPWSVVIWLVFELFNLRLQNWSYEFLPQVVWQRWTGYFISFATVLPAIFETEELLEALGMFYLKGKDKGAPALIDRKYFNPVAGLGIILILLPLFFPQYFFPLVWIAFIFLLEPVNYRLSKTSLFLQKEYPRIIRLALAGFICGVLWEAWNGKAQASWVYSLPYLNCCKIFAMPVTGYLGFLPFALECYLMYKFVVISGYGPDWESSPADYQKPSLPVRILAVVMMLAFIFAMFYLIDESTLIVS
jgi:hypothetical protein